MIQIQSIEYYKLYPLHLLKFSMRMILHESSMTQVSTIQEGTYTRVLAATERLVFPSDLDKKSYFIHLYFHDLLFLFSVLFIFHTCYNKISNSFLAIPLFSLFSLTSGTRYVLHTLTFQQREYKYISQDLALYHDEIQSLIIPFHVPILQSLVTR